MELHTTLETERGSRYLQTICKHFGRKVPVHFDAAKGVIELPFGRCDLNATQTRLDLSVFANTQFDLDRTVHIISSHMERFAFRENPEFTWQPAAIVRPAQNINTQSSSFQNPGENHETQ